jgi:hypothetical protein
MACRNTTFKDGAGLGSPNFRFWHETDLTRCPLFWSPCCCEQHFVPAHNPSAVLLGQKSICDNQSHHARENQQCREGFSDHWHRRMARSR